ncbi:type 1 glutamine amidotransferase family protein [Flavobacterium crassostreae]|uniref:Thiamine biosynthesis protein ThiJ n=1 Tax=Flavobacterium crassostreae TaxID=1763534 RepID=A0A1B9DQ53_9FLAO|nr:type 1 glutamine amidotransferase family protein [Flavobacterium crassostreae]OCB71807.1 thiamine biosynthesis protein ThiJ [Flavobacterium crassostreae]
MTNKIAVFLFNGFSDWEISYLTPEITKSKKLELIYFSKDGNPVTSMGGLQIIPTTSLGELKSKEIGMLILPGGMAWEKAENNELEKLTLEFFNAGKSIAAICAATTFLGQLGILNHLKHTSNDLSYLKAISPKYKGSDKYQNVLAQTDLNIITANGIAPIEFAAAIFKKTQLKSENEIEKWFQLFKNGIWSQ